MLAYTLSSQQKNEVPFEKICNVGPYEENEQCGDGDVIEKGNKIVLDIFKKKPYVGAITITMEITQRETE